MLRDVLTGGRQGMSRETVFKAAATVLGAIAGAAVVEGFLREPFQLDVTRLTIASPWLPAGFGGLKIVQLSDLHLHHVSRAYRTAIDVIRRERPHLFVITGDLVDRPEESSACLACLSKLGTAAGVPVVVVPGNWDHRASPPTRSAAGWHTRVQAERGPRVLAYQNAVLRPPSGRLWLVGTDDPY